MSLHKDLSNSVSVGGSLAQEDFSDLKSLGYTAVINFRPDGEAPDQLSSSEAEAAANEAGLGYVHIPVTRHNLFTDDVLARADTVFANGGRVHGYCASGLRAAIVWAAVAVRTSPVEQVLQSLQGAGFDLPFIRDDLDAQMHSHRWAGEDAQVDKSI